MRASQASASGLGFHPWITFSSSLELPADTDKAVFEGNQVFGPRRSMRAAGGRECCLINEAFDGCPLFLLFPLMGVWYRTERERRILDAPAVPVDGDTTDCIRCIVWNYIWPKPVQEIPLPLRAVHQGSPNDVDRPVLDPSLYLLDHVGKIGAGSADWLSEGIHARRHSGQEVPET